MLLVVLILNDENNGRDSNHDGCDSGVEEDDVNGAGDDEDDCNDADDDKDYGDYESR